MIFGCGRVLKLRAAGWSYNDLKKRKVPEAVIIRVQDIEAGIIKNSHDAAAVKAAKIHLDTLANYRKNSQVI